MLETEGDDRLQMYPASLHGITALVYALVTLADAKTIGPAIEVLAGVRHLAVRRNEPAFQALPLGELTTYGFELLIDKALGAGLEDAFRISQAYAEYAAERDASVLA